MTGDRYVVLGVARVRSPWFRDVARWSTGAVVAVEFVKAMSVEEVRVRLRSGRGYSALLADDALPGLDRDLVDLAREVGASVLVVDSGRGTRSLTELGVSAVLPPSFSPEDLLQTLGQVATPISRATGASSPVAEEPGGYRGQLLAVLGTGGTGSSTVAAALAQGLASDPRTADLVCLADLARHGEQAMLHGSPDVVPGVVELVEAHRGGLPSIDEVRRLTWRVTERDYHLLLGLRRHRDWTAVRPRAFSAALDGLRRGFRLVVADVDDDLEGELASGSIDVEERNTMARTTTRAADLVVVVGLPGLKGLHGLVRGTLDLLQHGVDARRLLPVVNRAPRGPRARAEVTAAFGQLVGELGRDLASPVFLAERRGLEAALRDGARLPDPWAAPLVGSVGALLEAAAPHRARGDPDADALVPVRPGELGAWSDEDRAP